jgi:alpha-tubulin suppressor-like RCC1 family protein
MKRAGRLSCKTRTFQVVLWGLYLGQLAIPISMPGETLVAAWGDGITRETRLPTLVSNITAVAAGFSENLAITSNGTVVAWVPPDRTSRNVPGLSEITAISSGARGGIALRKDKIALAWTSDFAVPNLMLSNIIAVDAGKNMNLALRTDGTVLSWGTNVLDHPVLVPGLTNVTAVAAGDRHGLALLQNGSVRSWGDNSSGQSDVPPGLSNIVGIAAGKAHSLAIRADGTVAAWGDNAFDQSDVPSGLSNVVAVAAGDTHSLALKADGTVEAWGNNELNQTDIPSGLAHVVAISAHGNRNLALLAGEIPPFFVREPQDITVPAGTNVFFLSLAQGSPPISYQWQFAGSNISAATTALGLVNLQPEQAGVYTVIASNAYGISQTRGASITVTNAGPYVLRQPDSRSLIPGATAVFSADIRGSQPLDCQWRLNGQEIPGATNQTLQLDNLRWDQAGDYDLTASNALGQVTTTNARLFVTEALVWYLGTEDLGYPITGIPLNFSEPGTNLIAVATSWDCTIALRQDGQVISWSCDQSIPTSATNSIAIAAGDVCLMALRADGTIVTWGNNYWGQLDQPAGLTNVIGIAARFHCLALKSNGNVVAWGDNAYGQTNVPSDLSAVIAVAAGDSHSLGLKSDGTVAAWGDNGYGQCNVPAGLSGVIAVAAGGSHSVALKASGEIVVWGDVSITETNQPADLTNVVAIAAGDFTTSALRSDGTLIRLLFDNPLQVPPWLSHVFAMAESQDNSGDYSVILANDGAPRITLDPHSQSARPGLRVVLHARAVGTQPLLYQWQRNGLDVPGATAASLEIPDFETSNVGDYFVRITNGLGSITSRPARLTALFDPLRLLTQTRVGGQGQDWLFEALASSPDGRPVQPDQAARVEVQMSVDLLKWVSLTNAPTLTNGSLLLRDLPPKSAHRFYRLVQH